jgi:hypothetical protein
VWAEDSNFIVTVAAPVIASLNSSQGKIVFGAPRKRGVWDIFEHFFSAHKNLKILTETS